MNPVLAGSGAFWFWVMNHQTAASTITIKRMIAHIGKLLGRDAACCARLAALVAVAAADEAALAAAEASALARWVAAAPRPPRPASRPVAPSAFESSGGSAAAIASFWLPNSAAIDEASDQFDGSCWPIVPIAAWATAPSVDCAAPCGAPANWLSAPARLATPEPPSRPPSRFVPSASAPRLPPPSAPASLVKRSGSELETASTTFWAPPGAAAVVASAPSIRGMAAAASFCATTSLIPTARARLPTTCGVRNWDTRLTRLIAIGLPLEPFTGGGDVAPAFQPDREYRQGLST